MTICSTLNNKGISSDFNVYMLLCGNNALKQKAVHSSVAYYVHILLYHAAKQMFHYIKSYYNLSLSKDTQ
jgi:hypothetical protein